MKVLLLCDSYRMAYRVMRSANHAGAETHVVGTARARGLALSRHCSSFEPAPAGFDVQAPGGTVARVNARIAKLKIDLVMPADPNTSRFLISVRDQLAAPIFPAPDLETFDRLNDKAAFTQLMGELGARCPPSRLFEDAEAVARAWERGEIAVPSIAKPLSQSGGRGVRKLTYYGAAEAIAAINYGPVLVQKLIDGLEVSAAVYCSSGQIMASIAYTQRDGAFQFLSVDPMLAPMAALAQSLGLTGIFGFDLIVSRDGRDIYWLECNPRVFFSIEASALAGVNLVAVGLGDLGHRLGTRSVMAQSLVVGPRKLSTIRRLRGLCRDLVRPWTITRSDWLFLASRMMDPMAFAIDGLTQK